MNSCSKNYIRFWKPYDIPATGEVIRLWINSISRPEPWCITPTRDERYALMIENDDPIIQHALVRGYQVEPVVGEWFATDYLFRSILYAFDNLANMNKFKLAVDDGYKNLDYGKYVWPRIDGVEFGGRLVFLPPVK